ncbi:BamA/TamA family outer membrane protein [bacterium]|nr:BamA/TamA family outer membrane protein [bacterium]
MTADRIVPGWLLGLSLLAPTAAQEVIIDADEGETASKAEVFQMPYAFSSATWDFALGYGAVGTGFLQDQLQLFGAVAVSTNETSELQLGFANLKLPGTNRLFLDGFLSVGDYTRLRAYTGLDAGGERAGANDSSEDNYREDEAYDVRFELPLRVVLPLGPGASEPIQRYELEDGLLKGKGTGGSTWNPLDSGRTFLDVRPFYRRQEYDAASQRGALATNGAALALTYDNRDFPRNPSRGSLQQVRVWRDFGLMDSAGSWTSLEAMATKYVDLGRTDWARQQVLAFGAWSADTPTWDDDGSGQPPYFMGATLGGRKRLRAYPAYRFNDRSAIHYWAEYRFIPGWQPLPRVEKLRRASVDWWQFALFAEAGRVAPEWDAALLHEDLKWDAGISLRIFAKKALFRFDVAAGPEQYAFLVDIQHPF